MLAAGRLLAGQGRDLLSGGTTTKESVIIFINGRLGAQKGKGKQQSKGPQ